MIHDRIPAIAPGGPRPARCFPSREQHQPKEGASVIVEGTVREVYRSPRQTRVDYVVQIDVDRSEYGRAPADPRRVQAPAPGDQVYVHVFTPLDGTRGAGHSAIPAERSQVRAYLYPRPQGGWDGAFPDWYDPANVEPRGRGANDPEPPAGPATFRRPQPRPGPAPAANGSILQKLGLRAEQVHAGGRLVLKTVDVVPDGPAAKAGIEPGDAIIGVNGSFITDLDQLAATILKGGPAATLVVLDVRTGKQTPVKVDVSGLVAAARSPAPARAGPDAGAHALAGCEDRQGSPRAPHHGRSRHRGPGREPCRQGGHRTRRRDPRGRQRPHRERGAARCRRAKRAARSWPSRCSIPARAGRSPSRSISTPRPPRPPTRPHRSAPANPAPAPGRGPSSARAIGLVVEAGTADLLPVVKVVQVVPGSPADKAGIEAGRRHRRPQRQGDLRPRPARRGPQDRGQLVHPHRARREDRQEDPGEDQHPVTPRRASDVV